MVLPRTRRTGPFASPDHLWLRVLCFTACIPSGGALLAKVYGVSSMQVAALAVALPGCVFLVVLWRWARRTGRDALADALAIGLLGGLLGTLAYDLIRVPFLLRGQRILAPISAYGVWIAEAGMSSRFTDVIGWTYHFSNGLTFGIMYALFMRGRHWLWAIGWAFLLETIAIVSPFADIFRLTGDYFNIGIAYLGHVAYGLPLGGLVYKWDAPRAWLATVPPFLRWAGLILALGAVVGPLTAPDRVERDARASRDTFRVEGRLLNPNWLRIDRGASIQILNPGPDPAIIQVVQTREVVRLASEEAQQLSFSEPGVYQVYVQTEFRSRSSFVIVEPVEEVE